MDDILRIAVTHGGASDSTGAIASNMLGVMDPDIVLSHPWASAVQGADIIRHLAQDHARLWQDPLAADALRILSGRLTSCRMWAARRAGKPYHSVIPANALLSFCIDPHVRDGLHEPCSRMSQFDYLREKLRRLRDQNPADLNLRSHHAVTWLCRSDEVPDTDPDASFIFAWISFNAAYARDIRNDSSGPERSVFQEFFAALVAADPNGRIAHELWYQHEGLIAHLLDNRFIFNPFWCFHNGEESFSDWQERFEKAKDVAREAIERENTPLVLSIIFDRLYMSCAIS